MLARISRIALWGLLYVAFAGAPRANAQTEANKATVERWIELWTAGDVAIVDEIFAIDFVNHDPGVPNVTDLDSYKEYLILVTSGIGLSDIRHTAHDVVAEGDKVAYRITSRYTMPDGSQVEVTGIIIDRFAGGKIVEEWWNYDMLASLEQRGLMPRTRQFYGWGEPSDATGDPGDPETNKDIVQRFVDVVCNERNLDILEELFIAEVVSHDPATSLLYPAAGIGNLRQAIADYLTAYPDLHVTIHHSIAEGDLAVAYWVASGTYQEPLMGIPATGPYVEWSGATMYRFADGKIVEMWWGWDMFGMMQQMPPHPVTSVRSATWGEVKSLFE